MASINNTPKDYRPGSHSGRIKEQSTYVGFVKRNDDAQRMGRISVWIPEIGGDPENEAAWIIVSYASPFAGVTDQKNVKKDSQTESGSQQSYGLWMQAPDLNNQVLVCFVNGDIARGYYFACIWQQNMNHMVPGIAAGTPTDPSRKNDAVSPPVVEYNRQNVQSTESPARPIFTPLDTGLRTEGLNKDLERGSSSSSVRREAPSKVFGLLTPRGNQMYIDDNEVNEFIRMRTRSGAQILVHETTGYVYINSANGNSWFEVSDSGIDMYTSNSISLRAQQDFNIRADRNIVMDAGNSIYMRAGQDVRILAGHDVNIGATNNVVQSAGAKLTIQSGTDFLVLSGANLRLKSAADTSIKVGANMVTSSSGNINCTSGGINARFGVTVLDNTGTGPTATDVSDNPATGPLGKSVSDIVVNGASLDVSTTDTIVPRMPTHEPWSGHPRRDIPNAKGEFKAPLVGSNSTASPESGCPIGVGAKTASNELFSSMKEGSDKNGLPLDFVMAVGDIESGFKSSPAGQTGGATGAFQFQQSTWNEMVSKYGAADNVGMGDINTERGSALMGARYLAEQKTSLQKKGIANPTNAQIYGQYNVGSGGYSKLLAADPNSSAVDAVGVAAAKGNQGFYYTNGQPNTVAQTLAAYDSKVNGTTSAYSDQAGLPPPCARNGGSGSVSANASSYIGGPPVGSGQCVALVQSATGVGNTSTWSAGAQVNGNTTLAPGTAIATFDSNGKYANATDGSSHAAIYQSTNPDGSINVVDQWSGQPPHARTISLDSSKTAANNAAKYYVINTPPKAN